MTASGLALQKHIRTFEDAKVRFLIASGETYDYDRQI